LHAPEQNAAHRADGFVPVTITDSTAKCPPTSAIVNDDAVSVVFSKLLSSNGIIPADSLVVVTADAAARGLHYNGVT
jgi:hypothetical protein